MSSSLSLERSRYATTSGNCGAQALGASGAVVMNNALNWLMNTSTESMTDVEKQQRQDLITSIIAGVAAVAGGNAAAASAGAQTELVNNSLTISQGKTYVQSLAHATSSSQIDGIQGTAQRQSSTNTVAAESCDSVAACNQLASQLAQNEAAFKTLAAQTVDPGMAVRYAQQAAAAESDLQIAISRSSYYQNQVVTAAANVAQQSASIASLNQQAENINSAISLCSSPVLNGCSVGFVQAQQSLQSINSSIASAQASMNSSGSVLTNNVIANGIYNETPLINNTQDVLFTIWGGGLAKEAATVAESTVGIATNEAEAAASANSAVAADFWVKPSGWRLPATNGSWAGTPGNSVWNSLNADVNAVTGGSGIPFVNGYPNFSQWSQGTFTFSNLTGTSSDFSLVYRSIANEYDLDSQTAAKNILRDLSLTPHHVEDGVTIQLVPTDLHSNVPHVGGASLLRNGQ